MKWEQDEEPATPPPRPPPELDAERVDQMEMFLQERGGAMDYGKFANAFPGTKKAQLEPHFVLVPEREGDSGGRWQITLPGVEPLPPDHDREERLQRDERRSQSSGHPAIKPSESLWLIGFIKRWDKKGFGFLEADGADNVFVHRNELPPELHPNKVSMVGIEMAFELQVTPEGKLRAKSTRVLLTPDGRGGWSIRRARV